MNIEVLPDHFNFPIGTMFWARTKALAPLIELNLRYEDFPEEPLPIDGTMLHALERLLPLITEKAGFSYALVNSGILTRSLLLWFWFFFVLLHIVWALEIDGVIENYSNAADCFYKNINYKLWILMNS